MFSAASRMFIWSIMFLLLNAGTVLQTKADTIAIPSPFDVMEGDRIAHTLCINCHVVDTHSPVIRTDRVPSFSWIAHQKGLAPTTLPVWLSTSHERMPDFNLTRDEIREVSAYILSLRQ
jgi:mono/diheme cytochrome c family protein